MKEWQKIHFNLLVDSIIDEYHTINSAMKLKNKHIYGVALITDSDGLTAYFCASTLESLHKKHKGLKWVPYGWQITNKEDAVKKNSLPYFAKKHIDYYNEFIVPRFSNSDYDYSSDFLDNIEMFTLAMKVAKQRLITDCGEEINNIIFLVSISGDDELTVNSAEIINSDSIMYRDFLEFYKSLS
jgi:hypothetical protein